MSRACLQLSSPFLAAVLAAAGALGPVGACYVGPLEAESTSDGTEPRPNADAPDAAIGEGGGDSTGLPCDVEKLLTTRCAACHAAPLKAPVRLTVYEDLTAKSKTDPARTLAEVALDRMQSASNPMPPAPNAAVPSADVAVLEGWIRAGYPHGSCAPSPPGEDAATSAPPPLVCTSGAFWSSGKKDAIMNPGLACIGCHDAQAEFPIAEIGGTVYPSLREPDLCIGANGPATGAHVVITDASGHVFDLPVGPTGNFVKFVGGTPVKMPFRAKVVVGGVERAMGGKQTSGDCNGCHTTNGANGAPGRITLP